MIISLKLKVFSKQIWWVITEGKKESIAMFSFGWEPSQITGENNSCSPSLVFIYHVVLVDYFGRHLGYHTTCLTPALEEVPRGAWYCPTCSGVGVAEAFGAPNGGQEAGGIGAEENRPFPPMRYLQLFPSIFSRHQIVNDMENRSVKAEL